MNTGSDLFGDHTTFKVQVNVNILQFEVKISVEALDGWLQKVKTLFAVNHFSGTNKIAFATFKQTATTFGWWESHSK